MAASALGAATGWIVVLLVAVNISLPYLLRGRLLAPGGWTQPYLERMRPHYWIGLTIAGLGLVHAGFAMSAPIALSASSGTGLWIATGGMLLAAGQALVGMQMRSLRGEARLRLRKTHFRFMLALVASGIIHIALNGVVAPALLRL